MEKKAETLETIVADDMFGKNVLMNVERYEVKVEELVRETDAKFNEELGHVRRCVAYMRSVTREGGS